MRDYVVRTVVQNSEVSSVLQIRGLRPTILRRAENRVRLGLRGLLEHAGIAITAESDVHDSTTEGRRAESVTVQDQVSKTEKKSSVK